MSSDFPGQGWARLISVLTLSVVGLGLAAAHVPFLIGDPWSSCKIEAELGCVLTYHLYEVPIVLFQVYFAWFGLRRLTAETVDTFRLLLTGSMLLNAVFALFEATLLLDSLKRGAPTWEIWTLAGLLSVLWSGVFIDLFVLNKLKR
jgi:D-arabinono-1,4-lactone oxidase